jgi:hypothetical protein
MAFKMKGWSPFNVGYQKDLIERSIKTTKGAEMSAETGSQNNAVEKIASNVEEEVEKKKKKKSGSGVDVERDIPEGDVMV